ncbi:MAG: acyltransferase family protein [Chloroflexi bacterium]|nr:acyltransferase family protein [Chloroflexota bacterium]
MSVALQIKQAPVSIARIDYIDIAKGIGILLVVMGHNDFSLISPFFFKLIYSFHMPLFFFMSGIFFKPDLSFLSLLRRRFDSVLRPYIFTILLIFFATISFTRVDFTNSTSRLIKALYGNGHYLDWVQLWFLPHLFAVSLFAFLFFQLVRRAGRPWLKWIFLAAIQIVGVLSIPVFWPFKINIFGRLFTVFGLPFSLDLVFISGFFFILGYELFQNFPVAFFRKPQSLLITGSLLSSLVWIFPATIDFNIRQFDSLFFNTLEALLGIAFILCLALQIERIPRLAAIFQYIGRASLIILLFQVPIQAFWSDKVLALTNNFPIAYWIGFMAGVLGPLAINVLFIQSNPIVGRWFGHRAQTTPPIGN